MDADRKAEKTSGSTSKPESAVKGAKPSAAMPTGGIPAYTAGPDGMPVAQPMPMPAPMMPYYGQYAAMYAMPPGAASLGFPVQQAPNTGTPPMWMPGMVPAPAQGGSPSHSITAQPYAGPYGTGAQPLMYMPVPYNYPPYVPAPSPAVMGAPYAGQPAKPPAQRATPPYGAAAAGAGAVPTAGAPAAPAHPHAASAEPVIISPPSMPSPASPSVTAVSAAAAAPAMPAVRPIEYAVMPLMPNTRLPPGDPFCPAGVTVPSQYAVSSLPTRSSAVPDRALTNGVHKLPRSAPSAAKAEGTAAPSAVTALPTVAATTT
ncbi:hypothetical protein N2W54_002400 [Lotmaria passim]